ncbi:helix-turn-helix domain-containing protein [Streptomyces sp. NBC_01216]|uniref:helix-turn-helix domain-containing protein n=1 Tax=Streptomyces sp. NBC_01216 TaxID=2903778 RepID=UPI002E14AA36
MLASVYDLDTRRRALALIAAGHSLNSVSRQTGVSRHAVRSWRQRPEPLPSIGNQAAPYVRCHPTPRAPDDAEAYAYLLGLHLGDGCISDHPRDGHHLRIACADAWPGQIDACREAITGLRRADGPACGPEALTPRGGGVPRPAGEAGPPCTRCARRGPSPRAPGSVLAGCGPRIAVPQRGRWCRCRRGRRRPGGRWRPRWSRGG